MFRTAAALAGFAAGLAAQSINPLTGPALGFAYDRPSNSLREVTGSLGGAALGPELIGDLDFATAAPAGNHAIACRQGSCFLISGLGTGLTKQRPIPDQIETPEGAVWSADGSTAALYSQTGQWVRIVRGLPSAVDAQTQWSSASLGGSLVSVSLSPDGGRLLLGLTGNRSGVFEVTSTGVFVPVADAVNPVAMAYAANGATLYLLDAGKHEVREVPTAAGPGRTWSVDAVLDPVGLQSGRDTAGRSVLYVAGRSDHALFVYDSATNELLEQIPLTIAPSQLQAVAAGSFLLTSRNSPEEVLWSYAAGRGLFFVPVTPAEADAPEITGGIAPRRTRR